jgi:hypothetical protein
MGDREQDVWRRPEEWSGAGKEVEQGSRAERRADRRAGVGVAPEIGAVRLGTEGRRDAEAQSGRRETHDPPARLTALDRSRTGLQSC